MNSSHADALVFFGATGDLAYKIEAYEKVLSDAIAGDATLFAREDYVEEAWRIVDPVLKAETPIYDMIPALGVLMPSNKT